MEGSPATAISYDGAKVPYRLGGGEKVLVVHMSHIGFMCVRAFVYMCAHIHIILVEVIPNW